MGSESVAPRYVHVVDVSYSPDGTRAVVFVEYNEPPRVEPYVVLCEKTEDGWVEGDGGSGGGVSWMGTHEAHGRHLGVLTTWDPPTANWNLPLEDLGTRD